MNWVIYYSLHFANFLICSHHVLDITNSVNELGEVRWQLALTLICAWTVVYFCMWKGVKSVGKVCLLIATNYTEIDHQNSLHLYFRPFIDGFSFAVIVPWKITDI